MITYLYLLIHAVILRNDDNNETPNKQFNSTMRGWTWSSCGSTAWSTGDGGDGGVAVQGVTVRAGVDDGGPLLTSPREGRKLPVRRCRSCSCHWHRVLRRARGCSSWRLRRNWWSGSGSRGAGPCC